MSRLTDLWLIVLCCLVVVILGSIAVVAATTAYDHATYIWCEHHPTIDEDGYPEPCERAGE